MTGVDRPLARPVAGSSQRHAETVTVLPELLPTSFALACVGCRVESASAALSVRAEDGAEVVGLDENLIFRRGAPLAPGAEVRARTAVRFPRAFRAAPLVEVRASPRRGRPRAAGLEVQAEARDVTAAGFGRRVPYWDRSRRLRRSGDAGPARRKAAAGRNSKFGGGRRGTDAERGPAAEASAPTPRTRRGKAPRADAAARADRGPRPPRRAGGTRAGAGRGAVGGVGERRPVAAGGAAAGAAQPADQAVPRHHVGESGQGRRRRVRRSRRRGAPSAAEWSRGRRFRRRFRRRFVDGSSLAGPGSGRVPSPGPGFTVSHARRRVRDSDRLIGVYALGSFHRVAGQPLRLGARPLASGARIFAALRARGGRDTAPGFGLQGPGTTVAIHLGDARFLDGRRRRRHGAAVAARGGAPGRGRHGARRRPTAGDGERPNKGASRRGGRGSHPPKAAPPVRAPKSPRAPGAGRGEAPRQGGPRPFPRRFRPPAPRPDARRLAAGGAARPHVRRGRRPRRGTASSRGPALAGSASAGPTTGPTTGPPTGPPSLVLPRRGRPRPLPSP